jgi:hypothetical protein
MFACGCRAAGALQATLLRRLHGAACMYRLSWKLKAWCSDADESSLGSVQFARYQFVLLLT